MDVIAAHGGVFLGSRLKRLAERMQAGAAAVIADAGVPAQPAHMPLLVALADGPMTIGDLADAVGASQPGVTRGIGQLEAMGLVAAAPGADRRRRPMALTAAGEAAMARARIAVWPGVAQAVDELCGGSADALLAEIARLEAALAERPWQTRVRADAGLSIRDYEPALAADFVAITEEWIGAMFALEDSDRAMIADPEGTILHGGGAILFVEAAGIGIVGTCALKRTGGTGIELTKMGVRPAARGLKAGEFLLAAAIERAQAMGADPLYLLTNHRCAAAIHLYEKLGFRHDEAIMAEWGGGYARCDVAMRFAG
ncbi:MAG: GNAT family N-acetyltransferase [Sphingomonas fennica]